MDILSDYRISSQLADEATLRIAAERARVAAERDTARRAGATATAPVVRRFRLGYRRAAHAGR